MVQTALFSRRRALALALGAAAIALTGLPKAGQASPVYKSRLLGVAIDGTDPVAYFTEKRPVPGKKEFSHDWNGATWRFSNAENLAKFKAAPEKYAPQFGGYCAWAVSQGYTASTDPEAWSIVDGRLYLNYSKGVQSQWEQDIPGNIDKGNANWPGLLSGLK